MRFYTGVGSRNTPQNILDMMTLMARVLESKGYVLRSGGAKGADSAFEQGVLDRNNMEIYYAAQASPAAMEIAGKYHPAWNRCSPYAKKLHGRNSFQVLGFDLDKPSEFLVCWTPDGCTQHIGRTIKTGGTGTAISIADAHGVKIINLQRPDHHEKMMAWLTAEAQKL